jgi:hypothetical protein
MAVFDSYSSRSGEISLMNIQVFETNKWNPTRNPTRNTRNATRNTRNPTRNTRNPTRNTRNTLEYEL